MTSVSTRPPEQSVADLARYSRAFYERGWMPGTAGNLSVRRAGSDDRIVITASGRSKGELTAEDLVEVSIEDEPGPGGPSPAGAPRPSAEVSIHRAIYRATRARAVVHVHSPYATAVATRSAVPQQVALVRIEHYELLKGLGLPDPAGTDLAVVPNWPDVPRIGADLTTFLSTAVDPPPGFLMAHHGITTRGADLAQARNRLECLESLCEQIVLASLFRPFAPAEGDAR